MKVRNLTSMLLKGLADNPELTIMLGSKELEMSKVTRTKQGLVLALSLVGEPDESPVEEEEEGQTQEPKEDK